MTESTKGRCEPCNKNMPVMTEAEVSESLKPLRGWRAEDRGGVLQLEKVYKFGNFKEAMAFTNAVGDVAEAEGHHPALLTEWGKVTVTWWTHKIGGLHKNDFIMATRTDAVLYG